jgi:glycosyltransferase involved in cell wall biosynthesis
VAPRVLVDATGVPSDRGGVGRYVDGLVTALAAAGADLAIACQRSDAGRYGRLAPAAQIVPGPLAITHRPARMSWEQSVLPEVARQAGAAVIHSPYYSMPMQTSIPVVVTVHDATVFSHPEIHGTLRGGFYRTATRGSVQRATRVIVPSKATREELVRLLDTDPAKIDVAYHGVDTKVFHPPTEVERLRASARLGLRGSPYVAFLGELALRQNLPALIDGWVAAVREDDRPPVLVLAGPSGWEPAINEAVRAVPEHLRVLRPGYLADADLRGYLGGALVAVFPSQSEGFGFPVLEAMACGTPVLVARRLSLPEVGGDAVQYTEPDTASIAENLGALLRDESRRAALGAAGQERAREFTWAASAEAHLVSYARAAES